MKRPEQARPPERRQGPHEGQPAGLREACPRSTAVPAGRRSAADRPLEDLLPAASTTGRGRAARLLRHYRRSLRGRPPPAARAVPVRDAARKVVGVGSVGTRAWVVLMLGNDDRRPAVPPGQGGPALGAEPYLGKASTTTTASAWSRASGSCSPRATCCSAGARPTGWTASTRDFYVRQLGTARARRSSTPWTPRHRGATRESAAGRWRGPTPAPVTHRDRRLPRHRRPLRARVRGFAESYADQNERDYAALRRRRRPGSGRGSERLRSHRCPGP